MPNTTAPLLLRCRTSSLYTSVHSFIEGFILTVPVTQQDMRRRARRASGRADTRKNQGSVRTRQSRIRDVPYCKRASEQKSYRLPTDVLNDVVRLIDVYPVKIDARKRAGVCSAVENWRHSAAGAAPVRPEVYDGDSVRVDLQIRVIRQKKTRGSNCTTRGHHGYGLTMLLNCESEVSGITAITRHFDWKGL